MKNTFVKISILLIVILAITLIILKPILKDKALDKAEEEIEKQVEQLNQDSGPTELDEVYTGPNDDRELPQEFL